MLRVIAISTTLITLIVSLTISPLLLIFTNASCKQKLAVFSTIGLTLINLLKSHATPGSRGAKADNVFNQILKTVFGSAKFGAFNKSGKPSIMRSKYDTRRAGFRHSPNYVRTPDTSNYKVSEFIRLAETSTAHAYSQYVEIQNRCTFMTQDTYYKLAAGSIPTYNQPEKELIVVTQDEYDIVKASDVDVKTIDIVKLDNGIGAVHLHLPKGQHDDASAAFYFEAIGKCSSELCWDGLETELMKYKHSDYYFPDYPGAGLSKNSDFESNQDTCVKFNAFVEAQTQGIKEVEFSGFSQGGSIALEVSRKFNEANPSTKLEVHADNTYKSTESAVEMLPNMLSTKQMTEPLIKHVQAYINKNEKWHLNSEKNCIALGKQDNVTVHIYRNKIDSYFKGTNAQLKKTNLMKGSENLNYDPKLTYHTPMYTNMSG